MSRPGNLVTSAHAVLLCGGSAFGLAAADGAMRYLEERGIGFTTEAGPIPIVPAAVLYDLGVGSASVRPTAEMGYAACMAADRGPVLQGCVGAGAGCTAGKALGVRNATKTGIGSASITAGSLIVGALVAVNPFGDIWDGAEIRAGTRSPGGSEFENTTRLLLKGAARPAPGESTCIGVVAVGGTLTKEEAWKVARMAHDGLARTISPVHTMYDGDTLFCLATGGPAVDVTAAGTAAAIVVELAVLQAVRAARGLGGLPAAERE